MATVSRHRKCMRVRRAFEWGGELFRCRSYDQVVAGGLQIIASYFCAFDIIDTRQTPCLSAVPRRPCPPCPSQPQQVAVWSACIFEGREAVNSAAPCRPSFQAQCCLSPLVGSPPVVAGRSSSHHPPLSQQQQPPAARAAPPAASSHPLYWWQAGRPSPYHRAKLPEPPHCGPHPRMTRPLRADPTEGVAAAPLALRHRG